MRGARQKKKVVINPCLVCTRTEAECEHCPYRDREDEAWMRTLTRDVYGYNCMDDD